MANVVRDDQSTTKHVFGGFWDAEGFYSAF